jgi:hypothetical protein
MEATPMKSHSEFKADRTSINQTILAKSSELAVLYASNGISWAANQAQAAAHAALTLNPELREVRL